MYSIYDSTLSLFDFICSFLCSLAYFLRLTTSSTLQGPLVTMQRRGMNLPNAPSVKNNLSFPKQSLLSVILFFAIYAGPLRFIPTDILLCSLLPETKLPGFQVWPVVSIHESLEDKGREANVYPSPPENGFSNNSIGAGPM